MHVYVCTRLWPAARNWILGQRSFRLPGESATAVSLIQIADFKILRLGLCEILKFFLNMRSALVIFTRLPKSGSAFKGDLQNCRLLENVRQDCTTGQHLQSAQKTLLLKTALNVSVEENRKKTS